MDGRVRSSGNVFLVSFFVSVTFYGTSAPFFGTSEAVSFPFRGVAPGDAIPAATLLDYKTRRDISLDGFKGQPLVVIFWGANIPTKRRRSLETLRDVERLKAFFEEHDVAALAINVQGDASEVIRDIIGEAGATFPMYLDTSRHAYNAFGIFVMPAILLVDRNGQVAAGMGYSRDLLTRLRAEVEILLGEKTRAQAEETLRLKMVEKSDEEKAARRHLNMGLVMIERGMPDHAIREFQEALKRNTNMGRAHFELGCLYVQEGRLEEAEQELQAGLELEPESLGGQLCAARLKALKGDLDEAVRDLKGLMLRSSEYPEVQRTLDLLREARGDGSRCKGISKGIRTPSQY